MTVRTPVDLSVVVSTYAWPEALDAVLRGLAAQRSADIEVIVAEDGESAETAAVTDRWRPAFPAGRLRHVSQQDEGFRLARIRDLGALEASGGALLFIDGDCVPRRGCARAVIRHLKRGWFLGSKRVLLSERLTARVFAEQLPVHCWSFLDAVLRGRGDVDALEGLTPRDRRRPSRPTLPDFVPERGAWGFFLGVLREDLEAVNGYDARFVGWGGEDVELAARLRLRGLRGGWAGPASTLLHLWHPDRTPRQRPNARLLAESLDSGRAQALVGLREIAQESAYSTTGSPSSRTSPSEA